MDADWIRKHSDVDETLIMTVDKSVENWLKICANDRDESRFNLLVLTGEEENYQSMAFCSIPHRDECHDSMLFIFGNSSKTGQRKVKHRKTQNLRLRSNR